MKYIKLFERFSKPGQYWRLRTDEPYFSRSIKYLNENYGCPLDYFDFLKEHQEYKEFLVIYSDEREVYHENYIWDWNRIEDEYSMIGFEYMGYLDEATPEHIEKMKLEHDAKKYNI